LKKIWLTYKDKFIKGIGAVVFLVLLLQVFLFLTYLFRGNVFTYIDRITVAGIKEEKKDSLDVICIGGSATLVFYEPLKAYRDYGFTSYDLATNGIQAESILAYMKYAQKYQNPDLYVVGVRAYQYYGDDGVEISFRISSDAMDVGTIRNEMISEYLKNRNMDTDPVSLYLEISKYHNNTEALKKPEAWRLTDNSYKCDYKGFELQDSWCYMEEPTDFQTQERTPLPENDVKVMKEMLEYCKAQNLNVLFVVCPYYATKEHYGAYNSIEDMVRSYGYDFLNANDYYEEMGINFAEDFYNVNHVNALGAEKYTAFLSAYIAEHYNLPDHRQDPAFAEWNQLAEAFVEESENGKQKVRNTISYAREASRLYEKTKEKEDFLSWASLVKDGRYQLICVGSGEGFSTVADTDQMLLAKIGLGDCYENPKYIRMTADGIPLAGNFEGEEQYEMSLGLLETEKQCRVDLQDGKKITIDGEIVVEEEGKGLTVLVYDFYFGTVLDKLELRPEEGKVVLYR